MYCCEFFIFIIGIFILCMFMLLCGYFLGGRSSLYSKCIPFESGVVSLGSAKIRFSIRFYLISMLFVIFDVEGVYLYIWSISIRESGWIGFIEAAIFICIMLISLLYLVRIGVFNWIKDSDNSNICE